MISRILEAIYTQMNEMEVPMIHETCTYRRRFIVRWVTAIFSLNTGVNWKTALKDFPF